MRNIVTFDIETTGLDKQKDFIIQFAGIKYSPTENKIIDELNLYIQPHRPYVMSIGALNTHKILPDFLKDKPYFKDVAEQIYNFINGCDIVSCNGLSFDAPFLQNQLKAYGYNWSFSTDIDFYDILLEERRRHPNTLVEIYKRYYNQSMEDSGYKPHNAIDDVKATLDIYNKQKEDNNFEPEKILTEDGIIKIMEFFGKETECFMVGKWKYASIEYVIKNDLNYISWFLNNPSFSEQTKNIIRKYLK